MIRIASAMLCATPFLAGCDDSQERGDFADPVDIESGRKLYLECERVGTPVVVVIPDKGGLVRATWREAFLPTYIDY